MLLSVIAVGPASVGPSAVAQPLDPQPCLPDTNGDGQPIFHGRVSVAGPVAPYYNGAPQQPTRLLTGMDAGDLDGDGRVDIAWVAFAGLTPSAPGYLRVLWGAPDGVFVRSDVEYETGPEGCDVRLGDLDKDGDLDAVVANANGEGASTVVVFSNDGTGAFTKSPAAHPVGAQARGLAIGDLNGDGWLDAASANALSFDCSILLNDGRGGFLPETRTPFVDITPRDSTKGNCCLESAASTIRPFPGDIDSDGDLDLLVPTLGSVRFLLNDGAGKFTLHSAGLSTIPVRACIMFDANGDQWPDVAAVSGTTVWLGTGPLQFGPPTKLPSTFSEGVTGAIRAGDLDADGDQDLVVGIRSDDAAKELSALRYFENTGGGVFAPERFLFGRSFMWDVLVRDFNGDGVEDAVGGSFSAAVVAFRGNPVLGPRSAERTKFPGCCSDTADRIGATADLDLDGDPDLLGALAHSYLPSNTLQLSVAVNDGTGTFIEYKTLDWGGPVQQFLQGFAAGHLDGDGWTDGVAVSTGVFTHNLGTLWVLRGGPGGSFAVASSVPLAPGLPTRCTLADFDGDGDLDVALFIEEPYPGNGTLPHRLEFYENDGLANLLLAKIIEVPPQLTEPNCRLRAGDFDGDGRTDLALNLWYGFVSVLNSDECSIRIYRNLGDGAWGFEALPEWESNLSCRDFVPLRLDGSDAEVLVVQQGIPTQPWGTPVVYPEAYGILVTLQLRGQTLVPIAERIERGDTLGFTPSFYYMNRGDLNKDGYEDIVAGGSRNLATFLGDGTGALGPMLLTMTPGYPDPMLADFDADGDLDAAACYGDFRVLFTRNEACPTATRCPADCDQSGELDIDDFICFQTQYAIGSDNADCDQSGGLDIDDFICFQTFFAIGC